MGERYVSLVGRPTFWSSNATDEILYTTTELKKVAIFDIIDGCFRSDKPVGNRWESVFLARTVN